MAATVVVHEANGVTPSFTVISVGSPGRFQTKDQNAQGDYPVQIAASGVNFSYWKHFCLDLSGSFTTINNVRLFCDGSLFATMGTDGGVFVGKRDAGDHGCPQGSYEEATGAGHIEGETGPGFDDNTNGHAYYKAQTANGENMENYNASGTSILIDSTDHTSAEKTKFAVLEARVDDDATQGEKADETFTFRYDEI